MAQVKFQKNKNYPRPHKEVVAFRLSAYDATKNCTGIPIVHYDEGLGSPSGFSANPQNSAFASTRMSNCYVGSRVDNVYSNVKLALTKGAIQTDKIETLNIAFMPIYVSFDDALAIDELTSNEIQDTLELTREATDRQTYFLYDGTKLTELYTNSAKLPTDEPGLTTTQVIENVAFSPDTYYNNLQYFTTANKLKSVQGGLKWLRLDKNHPQKSVNIKFRSKIKAMNEYTFLGVLIYLPPANSDWQPFQQTEVTNIDHVTVTVTNRFNEWNEHYDMERV